MLRGTAGRGFAGDLDVANPALKEMNSQRRNFIGNLDGPNQFLGGVGFIEKLKDYASRMVRQTTQKLQRPFLLNKSSYSCSSNGPDLRP
jgi:hypothetical protein